MFAGGRKTKLTNALHQPDYRDFMVSRGNRGLVSCCRSCNIMYGMGDEHDLIIRVKHKVLLFWVLFLGSMLVAYF